LQTHNVSRKQKGKAIRAPKQQQIEPMQIDEADDILLSETEDIEPSKASTIPFPISSIDICDLEDPQLVAEYVDDIFRNYFEVEVRASVFMN
jgi:hypothetical protein